MLRSRTYKPEIFVPKDNSPCQQVRLMAAEKLLVFTRHFAGGGSEYWGIETPDGVPLVKIRYADHANTSASHNEPDYNLVNGQVVTQAQCDGIRAQLRYPRLVSKTVLAKHLGLTVPKLKKILTSDCYEKVCLDPYYPNTFTEFVLTEKAVACAEREGIAARHPIEKYRGSEEDWNGRLREVGK